MDNSYLNMAHHNGRRAEKHLKYGRYEAAMECHQQAADLLQAAINTITMPAALQSLQLQRDFHIKYKDLVRMKRNQFEKYIRTMEQQKQQQQPDSSGRTAQGRIEKSCQLQFSIYKTMEDTDILLEQLSQSNATSGTDAIQALPSTNSHTPTHHTDPTTIQSNENGVIEELRSLNHQLHILVYALVSQMDEGNHETDALREQVHFLQTQTLAGAQQRHVDSKRSASIATPNPANTTIISDLVAMVPTTQTKLKTTATTTEKVVQQHIGTEPPISCGELPPLEMPKFDFNTFEEINN